MAYSPHVGRHVVAARDIKALEVVARDSPGVIAPHSRPVCLVCIRNLHYEESVTCKICRFPLCDEKCAAAHAEWPECAVFAELFEDKASPIIAEEDFDKPSVIYASVGFIRMLSICDESSKNPPENPTKAASWLLSLMDHMDDLGVDMKTHLQLLLETTRKITKWSDELKLHAFGILRINAFGFTSDRAGEGGRALYPLMSLFSHSCLPNAQHVQRAGDGEVMVVAQRNIAKGEEVAISYTNQFTGKV